MLGSSRRSRSSSTSIKGEARVMRSRISSVGGGDARPGATGPPFGGEPDRRIDEQRPIVPDGAKAPCEVVAVRGRPGASPRTAVEPVVVLGVRPPERRLVRGPRRGVQRRVVQRGPPRRPPPPCPD